MATEEPQVQRQKAELIDAIAENRRELADRLDSASDSLNLVKRTRQHFRDSTWQWLAAAAGSGLALGLSRPRQRPDGKIAKRGLAGICVQTTFTLLKPLAVLLVRRVIGSIPAATRNNGFLTSQFSNPVSPTRP